jgi:hypothetical protein
VRSRVRDDRLADRAAAAGAADARVGEGPGGAGAGAWVEHALDRLQGEVAALLQLHVGELGLVAARVGDLLQLVVAGGVAEARHLPFRVGERGQEGARRLQRGAVVEADGAAGEVGDAVQHRRAGREMGGVGEGRVARVARLPVDLLADLGHVPARPGEAELVAVAVDHVVGAAPGAEVPLQLRAVELERVRPVPVLGQGRVETGWASEARPVPVEAELGAGAVVVADRPVSVDDELDERRDRHPPVGAQVPGHAAALAVVERDRQVQAAPLEVERVQAQGEIAVGDIRLQVQPVGDLDVGGERVQRPLPEPVIPVHDQLRHVRRGLARVEAEHVGRLLAALLQEDPVVRQRLVHPALHELGRVPLLPARGGRDAARVGGRRLVVATRICPAIAAA